MSNKFIFFKRHLPFLQTVLAFTFSSFGGPHVHISLLIKYFCERKKYFSTSEIMEYYSICQVIPGPTSTQLLALVADKRGGKLLSIISLLIWIIPSAVIMTIFSYLIMSETLLNEKFDSLITVMQPMSLGFIIYSFTNLFNQAVKRVTDWVLLGFNVIILLIFFRTPWVFPILLIVSSVFYALSQKNYHIVGKGGNKKIRFRILALFIVIFVSLGYLSEYSRINDWETKPYFNVLENNYRFGSLVFGGGNVLATMMFEQYVVRKKSRWISKKKFLTGLPLQQVTPGPTFAISAYVGSLIFLHQYGSKGYWGALCAIIAIYSSGILLLYFFIPIWDRIKQFSWINRAVGGIYISVVAILLSAGIVVFDYSFVREPKSTGYSFTYFLISISVPFILRYTSVKPAFLVLIILGITSIFTLF